MVLDEDVNLKASQSASKIQGAYVNLFTRFHRLLLYTAEVWQANTTGLQHQSVLPLAWVTSHMSGGLLATAAGLFAICFSYQFEGERQ